MTVPELPEIPASRPRPAKFTVPRLPPGFLRRERLLAFLHQNVNRKLVLIAAAAGYGKTSLVADFARDTDFPAAWLALDESDRDVGGLAAHLVTSLRGYFSQAGEMTRSLLAGGGAAPQPEQVAATLAADIENLPAGYFILCLDDYHVVADAEPVGRFMARFLNLLPEQAHLMITSRAIPPAPFPIVPLAARQEIAGLNEEQLRFTPAEIQALLQMRNNIAVPAAEAEQLAANTEGWITGILLSSHLMWQGLIASWLKAQQADQPVYDYLADEVLGRLPEGLRAFLTESAILPEMEADACNAVLQRADSAEMLRQADEQRLFITRVGDEAPAYRYHQLFRDFLLSRLKAQSPDRLRFLQRRAAQWYEEQGWPEAAVTFYLAAGDIREAAAIAEASARALFMAGRHETLGRWGEQLAEVSGETPQLLLYLSKVYADKGNLAAAEASLTASEAIFREQRDEAGLAAAELQKSMLAYRSGEYAKAVAAAQGSAARAAELGLLDLRAQADRFTGLGHFALGDLAAAAEALKRAAAVPDRAGPRINQALALQDLSRVYRASGQTAQALRCQQDALAIWRSEGRISSLAFALNNVAWDKHMLGHYEDALSTYAEALTLARRAGAGPAEILVLAGQGDLMADLGELEGADRHYQRAIQLAESLHEVGYYRYLYRARARLGRWAGNYAAALEWLRRADMVAVGGQAESAGTNTDVLRASIWLDLGKTGEALDLLEITCANLEESGAIVDLSAGLFCLARARFAAGNAPHAFAALERSFHLAEQVGYDQMLLVEAGAASALLEAALEAPALRKRAEGLLDRAAAAGGVLARLRAGEAPSAEPKPAAIQVQALGGSLVRVVGQEVQKSEWASQQTRELFLFLVDRHPVRRDVLLDTFWPSKTPARAAANLHQALYQARKAVGREVIVVDNGAYGLAPGLDLEYDVTRFEQSAKAALALPAGDAGRVHALAEASRLYSGEYLADLPTEWAQERRRALSDTNLELLRQHARELYEHARYGEARQVIQKALEAEPCDDELNGWMLKCLASLGRRGEAVAHYQRYRENLRTELGLDPPDSVRELYARLIQ